MFFVKTGQLNSIGLLSGPSYRDSIGKRHSIGFRDTVSGRFLSGNFMAIGERCKSMCKTLSGETIHRAVALTVVAAERTVAAVPASAEAVRTAIGRDNPSGRGRPSGETFHRDLDKSSGETIHRAVAVHRERHSIGTWTSHREKQSIGPWPSIGRGSPSGLGESSGKALHRAVAVHREMQSIGRWPWPLCPL